MADDPRRHTAAARPTGASGWQPPEHEIEPAYHPVQITRADGSWAVGRINAWWRPAGAQAWCRVRTMGRGEAPAWMPFDPDRLLLLPATGI
ncbi:hypothetical protein ABTX81_22715 [Kitasatospora sp. NPDC097605]|uniref:hypothetical protein n=1 Tax=Kitasatospora sp. NPDC097605 TaxID=3157226 RepID=UPI00332EFDF2